LFRLARCSCFVLLKAGSKQQQKHKIAKQIMANFQYSKGKQPAHSNLFQFLFDFVNHSCSIASMPLEKPVQSNGQLPSSPYLKKINQLGSNKQQQLITIHI
jgi:hypothetical protein